MVITRLFLVSKLFFYLEYSRQYSGFRIKAQRFYKDSAILTSEYCLLNTFLSLPIYTKHQTINTTPDPQNSGPFTPVEFSRLYAKSQSNRG